MINEWKNFKEGEWYYRVSVDNFIKLVSDGFYDGLTFHMMEMNLFLKEKQIKLVKFGINALIY